MKSLVVITHGYPCKANRISQPFTREFALAVARQGVKVTVIAPLALHLAWQGKDPFHEQELAGEGVSIDVFRPRYLSASNRQVLRWNTCQIGLESFCMAVSRVLRHKVTPRPDALYGHFLYLGGAAATRSGAAIGIPSFVMVGEGQLCSVKGFGLKRARRHFAETTAFLPNSSCLADLLQQDLGVDKDKIGIFPNGVDHRLFYPRDRDTMRRKLGLPQDAFIVICVGIQDLQKGPIRVGEAIRGLEGVRGVFLGSGSHPPHAENIIFNGPVPHEHVPEWLSAADIFVLPSTYEGSCNAALEAMACGLPVVSSEGSFNDDILNTDVSIRVGPLDILAIREAIIRLRDNPDLRVTMGRSAIEWSERFDIGRRAQGILNFMEQYTVNSLHQSKLRR